MASGQYTIQNLEVFSEDNMNCVEGFTNSCVFIWFLAVAKQVYYMLLFTDYIIIIMSLFIQNKMERLVAPITWYWTTSTQLIYHEIYGSTFDISV